MRLSDAGDTEHGGHARRARRSDDCVVLLAQRGAARVAFLVRLATGI